MHKTIPNQLTIARLFLAGAFFVVLNQYRFTAPLPDNHTTLLLTALILFIIAAITDALDGYLARRWDAVTHFGRIVDPVADKILVAGAFIYLAGPRFIDPANPTQLVTGVYPWMVVVILLRELLVTSIRAALESIGIDFSAQRTGKLKMILQVIAIPVILIAVYLDPTDKPWLRITRDITVYATVAATILSGIPYITGAYKALKHTHAN